MNVKHDYSLLLYICLCASFFFAMLPIANWARALAGICFVFFFILIIREI